MADGPLPPGEEDMGEDIYDTMPDDDIEEEGMHLMSWSILLLEQFLKCYISITIDKYLAHFY